MASLDHSEYFGFCWTIVSQDIVVSPNYSVAGTGLSSSRDNLAVGVLFDYRVVDRILR